MAESERKKDKDNFTHIAVLVHEKSKTSCNSLIELELSNKQLKFEDFLSQHQHDIYHLCYNTKRCCQCSSAYKLPASKVINKDHFASLFHTKKRLPCHVKGTSETSSPDCCRPVKKDITTNVLDMTLSKVILLHFCRDVFWYSCLTTEDKTLSTFLDQNKHLIYHLWNSDTICCQCSKDPAYNFPKSSQFSIEEDHWDKLFKDKQKGCLQHTDQNKFANMICAVKANPDIRIMDISDEIQEIILKKCCNLRKSVDTLERNINHAYTHATSGVISEEYFKRYREEIENCIMEIGAVCGTTENEKLYLNDLSNGNLPDESQRVALQLEMLKIFMKEKTIKTTNYAFKEKSIGRSVSVEDKCSTDDKFHKTDVKVNEELENGHQCDICVEEQKTSSAEGWCSICEQFLCPACIQNHARIKVTKSHTVIKIQEYERIPIIKLCCEKHNKNFEMFCYTHEAPFCNTCDHKTCTIEKLERYVIGIKETDRFKKLQSSNEILINSLESFCNDVKTSIDSIPDKREIFQSEIRKSKEKIFETITDMEKQCLDDISKHESEMEAAYKQLNLCMEKIKQNKEDMSALKSYASDLHTFIGLVDVEKTYKKCENSLKNVLEESNVATIDPKSTFTAEKMKNAFFNMGFEEIKPPKISKDDSKVNIENVKLVRREDIEISIPKAAKDTVIRGCALLHNGGMCFTDRDNNRIVFHDPNGGFLFEKELDCLPIDVISVSESKIAISLSERRSIVLMDMEGIKSGEFLFKDSPGKFGGMAFFNGEIIVRVGGFGYYIINTKGHKLFQIEKSQSYMPYVARSNDRIYFTKWDAGKVFCCSCEPTGDEIWTSSKEHILKPPNGIASDEDGNIFVTGSYSNNVVFITSDGENSKEVIGGSNLQHPIAIAYDIKTKRLLVSCSSGQAFVYSVKMERETTQ